MVNILIDCPRADRGPKFLMITVFFFRLVARPIHLSVGESERKVTQADFFFKCALLSFFQLLN